MLFAAPYLFNAFRGMNGGGYGPARVGPGPFQGGPLASSRSARRFVKMATKIGDRLPTPPSAQGSTGLDETAEAPKRSISTGAATVALLERLEALRSSGALSEPEFQAAKARILKEAAPG